MQKTVKKADLSELIYKNIGLPVSECNRIVDDLFNELKNIVTKEGAIKISGFGSFKMKSKNSRPGRNPKTGQEYIIESRKVVSFSASNILKNKINS